MWGVGKPNWRTMKDSDLDQAQIESEIAALEVEHRDLDQAIESIEVDRPYDQLVIKRLKKRKLVLRDQISRLRDQMIPDIIA